MGIFGRLVGAILVLSCYCRPVSSAEFMMEPLAIPPPNYDAPIEIKIIGGRPANPAEWPATLRLRAAGVLCTSTVVGPRTILTSAHCVNNGGRGSIENGKISTTVTCYHHPQYDPRTHSADIALCLSDDTIQLLGANPAYETVSSIFGQPVVGRALTLQGFGCTGLHGPVSNILLLGPATVSENSDRSPFFVTSGAAAICSGDSGSPSFAQRDPQRRIMGVASLGNFPPKSFFVSTSRTKSFFVDWETRRGTNICGFSQNTNCHP
jgi:hypothetical protein